MMYFDFKTKLVVYNGHTFQVPARLSSVRFWKQEGEEQVVSSPFSPEQLKWINKALKLYGPTLGEGQAVYPGPRVAELSEEQKEALDAKDFLKWFEADKDIPLYGETGKALSGILSGTTGAQKITPEAGEKFFSSAFEEPMRKAFTKYGKPGIRESYAGPGFWSGARAKAETEGAGEVEDWLGEQRGGLMWDIEQANRAIEEAKAGRALSAVGSAMDYGGQPTREAAARLAGRGGVFGFLEVEQQQKQAEINAAIDKWAEEQSITDPVNLEILMSFLNMPIAGQITRTTPIDRSWQTMDWIRFGSSIAAAYATGGGGGGGMPTGSPEQYAGTTIYR